MRNTVAIYQQPVAEYPSTPPFNPPKTYPEFEHRHNSAVDESNHVFNSLRQLFMLLKYDSQNYDNENWNPLGWLVKPNNVVFIKPNMISEKHKYKGDDWNYVITHGAVIRAVIDYVFLALKGNGRVIIGDAPQTDSKFHKIIDLMGLREIQKVYKPFKDFDIEIINLQDEHWILKGGVYVETVKLPGDPGGRLEVDLGKESMFAPLDGKGVKYYGAFYDVDDTNRHHSNGKHEYAISKTPIRADVFINIPKLKTHKKCGLTVNLKSLVGINADKNWLPHYKFGSPETGGDQFPKRRLKTNLEKNIVIKAKQLLLGKNPMIQFMARKVRKIGYLIFGENKKVVRSGNWHGNDTVWRMALDLNRILMYLDKVGRFNSNGTSKKFLSIVDGIISMEGDGPTSGDPKDCGILLGGSDPVAVDATCAKIMGFNYEKLPIIYNAFKDHKYPLTNVSYDSILIVSNNEKWSRKLKDINYHDSFRFRPHFGWIRQIEEGQ